LEVETNRGIEQIPIFEGGKVCPGEVIIRSSERIFELPAGVPVLRFPLIRDRASQQASSYDAYLESSQLPLSTPVRVRLSVQFRYAEDAWRIVVRPVDAGALDEIEIRWPRREGEARRSIHNSPPMFPPQGS